MSAQRDSRAHKLFPEMPIQRKRNIYAFGGEFLVACPQCEKRATLLNHRTPADSEISLTCSSCGFRQQWLESHPEIRLNTGWRSIGGVGDAGPIVPAAPGFAGSPVYLGVMTSREGEGLALRLWLQTLCCGETLWFLNTAHLTFIESLLRDVEGRGFPGFDTPENGEKIEWLSDLAGDGDKEAVLCYLNVIKLNG